RGHQLQRQPRAARFSVRHDRRCGPGERCLDAVDRRGERHADPVRETVETPHPPAATVCRFAKLCARTRGGGWRSRMSLTRLCVALLALVLPHPGAAADCSGGAIGTLRLSSHHLIFSGTVTRRDLTHSVLVSGGAGLGLQVVDAADGSALYTLDLPPGRLVTHGRTIKYDRRGTFRGHLSLKDAMGQRDTVRIALAADDAAPTGLDRARALRLSLGTGGTC